MQAIESIERTQQEDSRRAVMMRVYRFIESLPEWTNCEGRGQNPAQHENNSEKNIELEILSKDDDNERVNPISDY